MENEDKYLKDLTAKFHMMAHHPPKYPPTTLKERLRYQDWEEICREIEREFRRLGVDL